MDEENDIAFREVEAALREEQRNRILRRIAPILGGGALLIIVVIGTTTWYRGRTDSAANNSAEQYVALITTPAVLRRDDHADGGDADNTDEAAAGEGTQQTAEDSPAGPNPEFMERAAALIADGTPTYQLLAKLASASALVERERYDDAASIFVDAARAPSTPSNLGALALIKAGYAAMSSDGDVPLVVKQGLMELIEPDHPFRAQALELLALLAYEEGDLRTARTHLSDITGIESVSAQMQYRTNQALRVINVALPPHIAVDGAQTSGSTSGDTATGAPQSANDNTPSASDN